MRVLRINGPLLREWLEELSQWTDLHVPVRAGKDVHRLEPYTSFDRIDLGYTRTILPPKKFLFPPEETLMTWEADGTCSVPGLPERQTVLFGVHPCDINGIRILDTFFASFASPDYYYQRRRQGLRIVGVSCLPDELCFCKSMNAENVLSGFDLFLHDLGDRMLVSLGTLEGDLLLGERVDTLQEASEEDLRALMDFTARRRSAFTLELDVSILPQAIKLHQSDPIWERLGEQCLTCGACSLGCPTCTCFDITDTNNIEGGARRSRRWDACLYRDFARVAGDHNFRPLRSQRVQNRYYHKQVGFAEAFGMPSCVGCGRCIRMCPTGIHFVEVFKSLGSRFLEGAGDG
ncbi:MAG: 4Fe-4S dicluster domain-containing protein [bacterium]|nr:MAG: 4Fe-4S dicluster domain-containing protein [bacterium]